MRTPTLLALLALLSVPAALAQGPAADWRTLTTPHFRVHYPAPSEAWARRAAARLESVRERVVAEVGYEPPEVVDVLVSDPVADPNGQALPFLGWPRMILWTSPPGPESEIGHYSDWSELVAVHEEAHLVHLLRPSRNPTRRLLEALIPLGPIPQNAPRWVMEGYATVVEGRLTGSGRPNGDLRAAILRRWAQGGKLPSYDRLASDSGSWKGMSMAYLLGSAYLEWLEEKAGPGSLRNLWARMTARTARSFDDAFRGVFGDSPADLYDRFRAELTWRAIEAEHRSGPVVEGELWQDLAWTTGAPAVSPDGTRLAAVLPARNRPSRLVVWSTTPDEEGERKWREKAEKLVEEDPEDVPAVRTKPLPLKPLHTYQSPDGPEPTTPRWMPDGKSILFVRFEPDARGFLHPDLFLWTPDTGAVRRLTREAGLRDPDPAPDGRWAAAVRNRDGLSQVVRVDLATGEVRAFTEPTVEEVYDQPRVSPDGQRIAYAQHREGVWRLVLQEVEGGAGRGKPQELAPPTPEGTIASPAWSADGRTVYAAVGVRGFVDLWAFPLDPMGAPIPLTRTQGAALAPAPMPDGSGLFFLSLQPDGFDLRRVSLSPGGSLAAASPPPADLPRELAPAIRPPAPPAPEPLAVAEVAPGRPYGLGRQELFPILSGSVSSAGGAGEIGLRGGDVLGRLDWLVLGALGHRGWPEGGALAATWRGWPVEIGFHAFRSRERPSAEREGRQDDSLDLDRQGLELSAGRDRQWSGGRLTFAGRALWNRIDATGSDRARDQEILSLAGDYGGSRRFGPLWRLQPGLSAHYEAGSTQGTGAWSRYGGMARLGIVYGKNRLGIAWQRDASRDVERSFDRYQLGGSEVTLLPESALSNRIAVPALPVGTLLGGEHEGQRADLALSFLPTPLFYERHRLWDQDGARGDWLSLAGLEYRFNLGPLPIGRLPSLDLQVGVAYVLDDPTGRLENDTRWWVITVVRP